MAAWRESVGGCLVGCLRAGVDVEYVGGKQGKAREEDVSKEGQKGAHAECVSGCIKELKY